MSEIKTQERGGEPETTSPQPKVEEEDAIEAFRTERGQIKAAFKLFDREDKGLIVKE